MTKLKIARDRRMGDHKDERGDVVIKIFLREKGAYPRKGNMTKTITIAAAKVSEVSDKITKLFS